MNGSSSVQSSALSTVTDNFTEIFEASDLPLGLHQRCDRDVDGTVFDPRVSYGFIMVPLTVAERKKRPSHIWEDNNGFLAINRFARKKEDCYWWICKRCHAKGIHHGYSAASTTHPARHLRHMHRCEDSASASLSAPWSPPTRQLDHTKFRSRLIEWTIKTNQTFRAATDDSLFSLLQSVAEDVDISPLKVSHFTLGRWVRRLHKDSKKIIARRIKEARSAINVSFDMWTSSNDLPMLAIVSHFIDRQGSYRSPLIALTQVEGSHTGKNIANHVVKVLQDYKLTADNIGYFVLDNASNNNTAIDEIARQFGFNGSHARLRCAGHIINLVCKAMLFGTDLEAMSDNQINADQLDHAISNLDQHILAWRKRGPVGKLHCIVRYIRSSPQRRRAFESRQEEAEVARIVRLMLNGGVRWNSTYNMIARAIRLKSAIDEYILHTPDLREDALTADDWHELAELLRLLKPLKRSTEDLEGNPTHGRGGALWEVLAHMERNLRELEGEKARLADRMEAPHLQASINLGWQVLDKYYSLTDETPAYRAAVVLHPMIKWTFFERNWPHEWIERAQKEVKTLWESYKTTGTPKKARQALPQPPDSQLRPDWHDHEWEEQMNNFIFATASSDTNLDEYHRYLAEPAPTGDPRAFDVLQWWIEHLYDYPQLSKMALDLLACPAMSADCERAFSSAGRNISKTRSRINDETAEATECLRSWLKQGWIDIEHWIVNGGMNKEDPEGEDDMDEDG